MLVCFFGFRAVICEREMGSKQVFSMFLPSNGSVRQAASIMSISFTGFCRESLKGIPRSSVKSQMIQPSSGHSMSKDKIYIAGFEAKILV